MVKQSLSSFIFGLSIVLAFPTVPDAVALQKPITKPAKKVSTPRNSYYNYNNLYSPYASWGISPKEKKGGVNVHEAWRRYKKRKTVIVAVIDTGIDSKHPFIKKNISVSTGSLGSVNFGVDFSKKEKITKTPRDEHGHGTHIAGIIKSVFPDVKILPLKYYNQQASGTENLRATIKALKYAVEKNVDIINYSGGGPIPSAEELKILKQAEKKGILIVAAAGNEQSNIDDKTNSYYPASYNLSNIITVTAHNQQSVSLSSANYGPQTVDISAPGHRIQSSLPDNQAGYLSGTSQATAFVTGGLALIKSGFPHINWRDIKKIIRSSADKRSTLKGKCITEGILNLGKALTLAGQYPNKSKKKRAIAGKRRPGVIIYRDAR